MASSSHNQQNTAVRGGTGVTKTAANTASDPNSSSMFGAGTGLHDTSGESAPKVPKNEMNTSGSVGDGTEVGRTIKEGVKDFMDKISGQDTDQFTNG